MKRMFIMRITKKLPRGSFFDVCSYKGSSPYGSFNIF